MPDDATRLDRLEEKFDSLEREYIKEVTEINSVLQSMKVDLSELKILATEVVKLRTDFESHAATSAVKWETHVARGDERWKNHFYQHGRNGDTLDDVRKDVKENTISLARVIAIGGGGGVGGGVLAIIVMELIKILSK